MKEMIVNMVRHQPNPQTKLNLLREYIQTLTLRSLHESEAFQCLSFVGGTALRFLYQLGRFSENLDFSLEQHQGYDGKKWMQKVKRDLSLNGFDVSIRWHDQKTVHHAWIRIHHILNEIGFSPLPEQNLSIKLEIDTHPPEGAHLERELVQRHVLFAVCRHDFASLFAGKLHALLQRPYTKGRDWFDLVWYCSHKPFVAPNLQLLHCALEQSSLSHMVNPSDWKKSLIQKLDASDIATIKKDVGPFLEHVEDLELLSKDSIIAALKHAKA